jgi:hypothetical protein
MPFVPAEVSVREIATSPGMWRLTGALTYTRPAAPGRPETTYPVPAHFGTDFASVPRVLTWLIPRYGRYTKAAIVHDHLCTIPERSRFDSDEVFRDAMKELGVPRLRRWLIWAAVTWATVFAVIYGHVRTGRQLGPLVASAVSHAVLGALVVLPGDADAGGWWRWIALLALVASFLLTSAALLDERVALLLNWKFVGVVLITIFGTPFLLVGLVNLIALAIYAMFESGWTSPAPPSATPTPDDRRRAQARERARAGS